MIWSGAKLKVRLPGIVSDFDSEQIDCAAYTLRMGSEVYISPTEFHTASDVVSLKEGESFNIPPGQFAFLLTAERLELPKEVLGLINMKSTIKLRGLVNVSGFHVDPGYKGRLVFSVFNAGPRSVSIRRGDPCFLLWLADLAPNEASVDPGADYEAFSRKKKGFDHIGSDLVSNMGGNVLSLFSLNEKIDKMQLTADRWIIALAVVTTIVGALAVGFALRFFSGT